MATEAVTPPTPEDQQREMADTCGHLGDQAQALGDKVLGMAQDANAAIAQAVRGGREAVEAAQVAVRDAGASMAAAATRLLDVQGYVRQNPWLAVGGAVAVGFLCANFLRRR